MRGSRNNLHDFHLLCKVFRQDPIENSSAGDRFNQKKGFFEPNFESDRLLKHQP